MASKLSRRPLRRIIKFQVELGPWSVSFRDGKERARVRYVLWISEVPKGQRGRRFMSVVQAVHRGSLADEVHNPILFRNIVTLPNNPESEWVAKGCYRRAQKAMYFLLKDGLEKASRPMLRVCGTDVGAGIPNEGPLEWENFDVGFLTDTLGEYRKSVPEDVKTKHLGSWWETQSPTTTTTTTNTVT